MGLTRLTPEQLAERDDLVLTLLKEGKPRKEIFDTIQEKYGVQYSGTKYTALKQQALGEGSPPRARRSTPAQIAAQVRKKRRKVVRSHTVAMTGPVVPEVLSAEPAPGFNFESKDPLLDKIREVVVAMRNEKVVRLNISIANGSDVVDIEYTHKGQIQL